MLKVYTDRGWVFQYVSSRKILLLYAIVLDDVKNALLNNACFIKNFY